MSGIICLGENSPDILVVENWKIVKEERSQLQISRNDNFVESMIVSFYW